MKKQIVIHATKSPEDIVEMNSQERFQDAMQYHYIVNTDGTVLKGRADRDVCEHCGRWSGNSISVAYAGGLSAESGEETDTLSETQEKGLRTVLNNLLKRHTEAEVVGTNKLLHPDEARKVALLRIEWVYSLNWILPTPLPLQGGEYRIGNALSPRVYTLN
ncbi:MAG: N-acetylmuramoyl-L-alanine amidase [Paludibacteraceae bacterium]|nr:N-acetylmuramoyl-L-alanine amidase [Paludibacteraceae bacterium]